MDDRAGDHDERLGICPEPEGAEQSAIAAPSRGPVGARTRQTNGITADGRLVSGRLKGLTIWAAIWTLSWPILVESLLNSLVGLTDTVLSASIDDGGASTDAIGGAAYIMWFVGLIGQAIGVGATALISRAVGAGKFGLANTALGQTMTLAFISGVFVAAGMMLAIEPLTTVLSLNEAAEPFRSYLFINALGVPFGAVLLSGNACARGAGDSIGPLKTMIAVNIVNLVASWVLAGVDLQSARIENGEAITRTVLENPFPFDFGVAGIALGTVLSHFVGALFILGLLGRGVDQVKLRLRRLKPHWHTARRVVRVGLPNFFEMLGMWIGNFAIVLMVGWMGAQDGGMLGSHFIAIRIEAFSFLPGFSISLAAATLVGQYLGAGSPQLAARATWICTALASVLMMTMGVFFITMPTRIVGLLTAQEVHLEHAPKALFITGMIQIPFAVSIVLRSALRGAGDVKAAMIITWIMTYGVRMPLAFLLSGVDMPLPGGGKIENPFPYEWGLAGLWAGLSIEIVVRAIAFTWRFLQGKWKTARV